MSTFRELALLFLLSLALAGAMAVVSPFPLPSGVSSLRPGEIPLRSAREYVGPQLWIDARPEAAYRKAHISGALPLTETAWDAQLAAILEEWTPEHRVIVYCSEAECLASHEVAHRLREEAGLPNVVVLKGGWEAWRTAQ